MVESVISDTDHWPLLGEKKKCCRKHIRTCKKIFSDRILHTALVSACDCCSGAVFVSVGNTFSVECWKESWQRLCCCIWLEFSTYLRHVFDTVLPAANEIQWYLSVFATARNGFFFGFPFVTMGYLFRVKADGSEKVRYGWYTVFFLVLMMLEEWIITQKIGESSHDMYLMTPLVTANLSWLQPLSQWGREWERLRKQCVNSQRKFSFCTSNL